MATMNGQMTLMNYLEKELSFEELPDHIGETLHNYEDPAKWFEPAKAPDEYVVLLEAYRKESGWFYIKYSCKDGKIGSHLVHPMIEHSNFWIGGF